MKNLTIIDLREYRIVNVGSMKTHPYQITIDGKFYSGSFKTKEAAADKIEELKKEYERWNCMAMSYVQQLAREIEKISSDLVVYGTLDDDNETFQCRLHKIDIDDEENYDFGPTMWIVGNTKIELTKLTDFGFSLKEAKEIAKLYSMYTGKMKLTHQGLELYSFEKGKEV